MPVVTSSHVVSVGVVLWPLHASLTTGVCFVGRGSMPGSGSRENDSRSLAKKPGHMNLSDWPTKNNEDLSISLRDAYTDRHWQDGFQLPLKSDSPEWTQTP
jgi:hypothetical protein